MLKSTDKKHLSLMFMVFRNFHHYDRLVNNALIATSKHVDTLKDIIKQKDQKAYDNIANNLIFVKLIPYTRVKNSYIMDEDIYNNLINENRIKKCNAKYDKYGNYDYKNTNHGLYNMHRLKILRVIHRYQFGIQTPLVPFDDDPTTDCSPGGLYFPYKETINDFVHYGTDIAVGTLDNIKLSEIKIVSFHNNFRINKINFKRFYNPESYDNLRTYNIDTSIYVGSHLVNNIKNVNSNILIEAIYDKNISFKLKSFAHTELYRRLVDDQEQLFHDIKIKNYDLFKDLDNNSYLITWLRLKQVVKNITS